jgi:hypothetical protein
VAYELTIEHPSRHVPWGGASGYADLIVLGENLSAATFVWAFADTDGGTPVITLSNASAGSQGVSATWDASYIHPESGEVVGATVIRPQIDEATFEALSGWTGTKTLYHDLLITPSGLPQFVECYGTMTVRMGIGD